MKTTKRALFSSVIALILCFSMLVGTTFAWFTDSVESGTNQIVAGNLDVELFHTNEFVANDDVAGETALFVDKNGNPIKWEPGAVAYEVLTVENKGTLALKYQMAINFTNENEIKGTGAKLSQILKIAVVDASKLNGREAALAEAKAAENAETLHDFVLSGELNATNNTSKTYGIVIWWEPSDEDDKWNVNNEKEVSDFATTGKNELHIDLGIKLVATQVEGELDSFGPDYDEDAWHPAMEVYSANDLQAAINNGKTNIVLMDDIELTESIVIPAPAATTYSLRTAATVIDLNGNEITSNLTSGRAILVQGAAEIKNGKISTTNGVTGLRATGKSASLTLTDMTVSVTGTGSNAEWNHTAIGAANGATVVINNGTYSAEVGYGLVTMTTGADITINDGTFTTKGTTNSAAVRFDSGWDNSKIYTKAIINGGEFNAPEGGFAFTAINAYGKDITINGGTFNGELDSSYQDNGVVINGGTFNKPILQRGGHQDRYLINGGTFVENVSAKVANGYTAVQNADGTYSVIFPQESFDNLIENAGDNATIDVPAGTYTFPASDLKAGQTLNCAPGTVFNGKTSLNINGATVVGATFTSNNNYLVYQQTVNGTFKDCVFTNSDGLRSCYAGETVVFENCVFDTDFYGVHFDSGANPVVFKNCTFSGFNTFGAALTKLTLENCTFKYNGKGGYNGINMWGNTDLINCTFVFDGRASTEWVHARGTNKEYTFTNCIVTDGTKETPIENVFANNGTNNTVIIDGVPAVYSSEELNAAIAGGAKEILLTEGNYIMTNTAAGVTLKGVDKDLVVINNNIDFAGNAGMNGAITKKMTFENITFENTVFTMENGGQATFTNVYFKAGFRQGYGTAVVFNNCTFGENTEGYALHFQSDSKDGKITLNGCKFEGGKVHLGGKRAYAFANCEFAAGTDFQIWSNITLENCTVNGEKVTAENMATLFPKLDATKVTLK